MTRLRRIVALGLLVAAGCAHTKTTDQGDDDKKAKPAAAPRTEEPRPRSASRPPARREGGADAGDQSVPLATAPGGLLAPGAEQKIRERLVAEGCLADDAKRSGGALSEGLRRCQTAHDLPATGMPDDATIKALGLEPGQIFRHGPVKD